MTHTWQLGEDRNGNPQWTCMGCGEKAPPASCGACGDSGEIPFTGRACGCQTSTPLPRRALSKPEPVCIGAMLAAIVWLNSLADDGSWHPPKVVKAALQAAEARWPVTTADGWIAYKQFIEEVYMDKNGIPPKFTNPGGQTQDKTLAKKIEEVVAHLIAAGANRKDFQGVTRALSVKQSPLHIDLLHGYLHNRFVTPKERDLTAAWDEAQRFFEKVWP